MGTFWHVLRPNRVSRVPSLMAFYDTETQLDNPQVRWSPGKIRIVHSDMPGIQSQVLKLGWLCVVQKYGSGQRHRDRWIPFRTRDEFWEGLLRYCKPRTRMVLWAHNQQFDFSVVDGYNRLAEEGWGLDWWSIDCNHFIMRWKKNRASLLCLDTLNYWSKPLSVLGQSVGIAKGKVDFATVDSGSLADYCRNDVEILKKFVLTWLSFISEHDLGGFRPTIGAQAFQAFRHRFMHHRILIHADKDATMLERESYRGGRNECFRLGHVDGPVYCLDINSAYPSVMLDMPYPRVLNLVGKELDPSELDKLLEKTLMVADMDIRVDEPAIAIRGERLTFPVGEFNAVLTTPEIQYVQEHGEVLAVHRWACYTPGTLFDRYVEELYRLRSQYTVEGNDAYRDMIKLLMNSLYGKFGQLNEEIIEIGPVRSHSRQLLRVIDWDTMQQYTEVVVGGVLYRRKKGRDEAPHSGVAIASHVTAYLRMKLWSLISEAGYENTYYVDTDSLYVNEEGYRRLQRHVNPSKLGMLKLESVMDKMEIRGCKDYTVDDVTKIKGIRKNAVEIRPGVYEQEQFLKFRTQLKTGLLDKVGTRRVTKVLDRKYRKGVLQDDGSVLPLQLSLQPS